MKKKQYNVMNYGFAVLFAFGMIWSALPASAAARADQVVNIIVTSQKYDYNSPWQKGEVVRSNIQGCVIDGKRIVTSAYALADHVLIEVLKKGESRKYQAAIVIKDYHSGIALLKVDDDEFFSGLSPVVFSKGGSLSGRAAAVYKWDSLSSLKEYTAEFTKTAIRFYEPSCGILMHQFTTSMNDGGKGEPVFVDDALVGIATGLNSETKTLYVISSEAINKMLADSSEGSYEGIPFFWIDCVEVQSDANLREYYGMNAEDSGVLVTEVPAVSSGGGQLRKNDIILAINGIRIDDSGMYNSPYGKLYFYGLIQMRSVGDTVTMKLLREKKRIEIHFQLKPIPSDCCTVPLISYDRSPAYYIYGGVVFQELSMGLLESWGTEWKQKADKRILYYFDTIKAMSAESDISQIIILNRVLPDTMNKGYHNLKDMILKSVNGITVKNIRHLKSILDGSAGTYSVFEFVGHISIVLERKAAVDGGNALLKKYNIDRASVLPGE